MSSTGRFSGSVGRWLPVLLRVVAVTLTAYPAVRKFLEYSYRVQQFASYGIPWPEVAVPVTGLIELVAIALLAAGFAGRLGAGMLVGGMVVVAVTAGPNPFSVAVLLASAGILVLGTGPYSVWDPTVPDLLAETRTVLVPDRPGNTG